MSETPSSLVVLTGGSSGLGLAMATQLSGSGHRVLSLALGTSDALPDGVEQWDVDLSDAVPVAARLREWLGGQDVAGLSAATLISNAGINTSPAPLRDGDPAEVSRALRVDLEAAVLVTQAFLAATHGWAVPRKVLLISSGVGRTPLEGAATYGAAKAGLDHLARGLALEERPADGGAAVVSLAPGRFETPMMALMRDADPAKFPDRDAFVALQADGGLDTPDQAAAKVLAFLDRPDFGSVAVADVRSAPAVT